MKRHELASHVARIIAHETQDKQAMHCLLLDLANGPLDFKRLAHLNNGRVEGLTLATGTGRVVRQADDTYTLTPDGLLEVAWLCGVADKPVRAETIQIPNRRIIVRA